VANGAFVGESSIMMMMVVTDMLSVMSPDQAEAAAEKVRGRAEREPDDASRKFYNGVADSLERFSGDKRSEAAT
jgi:hypothetical protein